MTTIRVFVAPSASSSSPGVGGERRQVAGVEPDAAELGAGDLDRRPDALVDVVGVDEQRRPGAEGGHLRPEGRLLVVVQQREGVRAGAAGRDAVAPAGLEVGGRRRSRPGTRRGPRRRRPPRGCGASPSRCTGRSQAAATMRAAAEAIALSWLSTDRASVSSSTPSANGRADGEHRRAGEVEVALGVAVDVAGEPEVGQPVEQPLVGHALLAQRGQLVVPEPEVRQRLQQPAGAGERRRSGGRAAAGGRRPRRRSRGRRCRRPARRRPSSARTGR